MKHISVYAATAIYLNPESMPTSQNDDHMTFILGYILNQWLHCTTYLDSATVRKIPAEPTGVA
ncbi:MAG: hypothetical protein OFPII_09800 [Osedax symbiont Rs1]|nr:MAG: hypothetical protein OFPII_09800 [Osedax symbiont Rs1]